MRTRWLAAVLLVSACATTPPGPTMEQFRALEEANASLERERTAFEEQVGVLRKVLDSLERKAEGTTTEILRLTTEIKRLEGVVANSEARLDALKAPHSSEPNDRDFPTFHSGPFPTETVSIKGQVLAADPEKNIYLVSVGKKDGVKIADELTVFRGDSFVAVVVVDQVFEDKASVVVKKLNGKPMRKSEIKVDDKVATAL